MKRFVCLLLISLMMASSSTFAQQGKAREILYVGTYADRGSEGIYVLEFNRATGVLSEIQTVTDKQSPTFLEVHPNGKYLYAAYREGMTEGDENGTVTAFTIDPSSGKLTRLNEQSSAGQGPCHVSVDPKGRFVYVSNYGGGNLAVYPIQQDGSLGTATDIIRHAGSSVHPERQKKAYMHSMIPTKDGKFVYASDLGIDKIMIYAVDQKRGKLSPASKPFVENVPGSGPRHLALHPSGNYAFSLEELTSTVASFTVDPSTGALHPLEQVDMLPEDFEGSSSAADIHISPDGKFLYASNRGHDSLVIYAIDAGTGKLTYVGHESNRIAHPRNFCIDEKGEYIFVANRDNDNVVVFRRDQNTGKLNFTGQEAKVPAAVCIQQLFLK